MRGGRYDVPGETFYVAETRTCAYAEVLSTYKRANGAADPLAHDAKALGMTVEEFIEEVASEWAERDFMGLGAIPAGWRLDRGIYSVALPEKRWLVDIEHPDSMSALEQANEAALGSLYVGSLATGVLRSERRDVTTLLASWVHDVVLDDGSAPMGIHFGSKHGAAWCKGFWLDHPYVDELLPLSPDPVLVTDVDLITAADRFRIRVF